MATASAHHRRLVWGERGKRDNLRIFCLTSREIGGRLCLRTGRVGWRVKMKAKARLNFQKGWKGKKGK